MMDSSFVISSDTSSSNKRDRDEDDYNYDDDILVERMMDLCLFSSSQAFTSFTTKRKLL